MTSMSEQLTLEGFKPSTTKKYRRRTPYTAEQRTQIVDAFFHAAKDAYHPQNTLLKRISTIFLNNYHMEPPLNRECLVELVNNHLKPYLCMHRNFVYLSDQWKAEMILKLLDIGYGKGMLHTTVQTVTERHREQERRAQQEAERNYRALQRQNRPVSPFEWTDPMTQRRCFDSPDNPEEVVQLPPEAPPRPSATARWNKIRRCWMTAEMSKAVEE